MVQFYIKCEGELQRYIINKKEKNFYALNYFYDIA